MSLIKTVAAIVEELGEADADAVWREVEGSTREQVIQALQNAKYTGLLVSAGAMPPIKGSKAARLTTYRPAPVRHARPVVASVWDLGLLAANDSARQRA